MYNDILRIKNIDPDKVLALHPTIYSKAKSIEDVVRCITAFPAQRPTSEIDVPEGITQEQATSLLRHADNNIVEFNVQGDSSCGTLYEIQAAFPSYTHYCIQAMQGNGICIVEAKNGAFQIA